MLLNIKWLQKCINYMPPMVNSINCLFKPLNCRVVSVSHWATHPKDIRANLTVNLTVKIRRGARWGNLPSRSWLFTVKIWHEIDFEI